MLTNLQGSPADTMGFMAKYDRYGNILWARNVFGTNNSQMGFTAIAEDRWQNVFAVGGLQNFFQVGGLILTGLFLASPYLAESAFLWRSWTGRS